MGWTVDLAFCDAGNPSAGRILHPWDHVCFGGSKRGADLGERNHACCDHPARRTFVHALHWTGYRALVEVDFVGLGHRDRIGSGRCPPGFSHWLREWSRLCCIRKTTAVVDHRDCSPRGVVEELFYRGYAIERLRFIGLGRFWSVAIPLVIFSLGHWTGGAANILIAFVAALILTGFYLWRRDLVANMIGHGLVDFVANVVPKLFS